MATYYLRPSADTSLQHSCSTGSTGYNLINEETSDEDSKYIYNEFTGSSSSGSTETKTSSFTATGTIPSNYIINSATLYIRAKRGGSSSSDSTISGAAGSSEISSTQITTSYTNYTCNVDLSNLTRSGNTVTSSISVTTAIKCYKNDTGHGRITQAYIAVDVTPVSRFYFKQSGNWSNKNVYQKIGGTWQLLEQTPSDYSNGTKIVQK